MTITNRTTFLSLLSSARRGLLVAGLLLLGSAAQATPLDVTLSDFPDIVSMFIDVTYDAGTDLFTATGYAMELDHDGSPAVTIIITRLARLTCKPASTPPVR